MPNDYTKKHSEMYGDNLKELVCYQSAVVTNGKSYLVLPLTRKIKVKKVQFAVDNTAGADSAHSDLAVYKGTLAAIAAASAAGNLTGLTAVATKTLAAADIAKSTVFELTLAADSVLEVDGTHGAPTGLCFYATSPGASDTVPIGKWVVDYVLRDVAP